VTFSLKDAGAWRSSAPKRELNSRLPSASRRSEQPAYWQNYVNRSDGGGSDPVVNAGGPERAKPTPVAGQAGVYTYTFCTPLAAAATIQYYGSGVPESAACAAVVPNSGAITGAAWDAFKGTLNLAYDAAATTRVTAVGRDGALVNLVQDFVPSALPTLPTAFSAQIVPDRCGACHPENSAKRNLRIGLLDTLVPLQG
jgi:hypothetical protein